MSEVAVDDAARWKIVAEDLASAVRAHVDGDASVARRMITGLQRLGVLEGTEKKLQGSPDRLLQREKHVWRWHLLEVCFALIELLAAPHDTTGIANMNENGGSAVDGASPNISHSVMERLRRFATPAERRQCVAALHRVVEQAPLTALFEALYPLLWYANDTPVPVPRSDLVTGVDNTSEQRTSQLDGALLRSQSTTAANSVAVSVGMGAKRQLVCAILSALIGRQDGLRAMMQVFVFSDKLPVGDAVIVAQKTAYVAATPPAFVLGGVEGDGNPNLTVRPASMGDQEAYLVALCRQFTDVSAWLMPPQKEPNDHLSSDHLRHQCYDRRIHTFVTALAVRLLRGRVGDATSLGVNVSRMSLANKAWLGPGIAVFRCRRPSRSSDEVLLASARLNNLAQGAARGIGVATVPCIVAWDPVLSNVIDLLCTFSDLVDRKDITRSVTDAASRTVGILVEGVRDLLANEAPLTLQAGIVNSLVRALCYPASYRTHSFQRAADNHIVVAVDHSIAPTVGQYASVVSQLLFPPLGSQNCDNAACQMIEGLLNAGQIDRSRIAELLAPLVEKASAAGSFSQRPVALLRVLEWMIAVPSGVEPAVLILAQFSESTFAHCSTDEVPVVLDQLLRLSDRAGVDLSPVTAAVGRRMVSLTVRESLCEQHSGVGLVGDIATICVEGSCVSVPVFLVDPEDVKRSIRLLRGESVSSKLRDSDLLALVELHFEWRVGELHKTFSSFTETIGRFARVQHWALVGVELGNLEELLDRHTAPRFHLRNDSNVKGDCVGPIPILRHIQSGVSAEGGVCGAIESLSKQSAFRMLTSELFRPLTGALCRIFAATPDEYVASRAVRLVARMALHRLDSPDCSGVAALLRPFLAVKLAKRQQQPAMHGPVRGVMRELENANSRAGKPVSLGQRMEASHHPSAHDFTESGAILLARARAMDVLLIVADLDEGGRTVQLLFDSTHRKLQKESAPIVDLVIQLCREAPSAAIRAAALHVLGAAMAAFPQLRSLNCVVDLARGAFRNAQGMAGRVADVEKAIGACCRSSEFAGDNEYNDRCETAAILLCSFAATESSCAGDDLHIRAAAASLVRFVAVNVASPATASAVELQEIRSLLRHLSTYMPVIRAKSSILVSKFRSCCNCNCDVGHYLDDASADVAKTEAFASKMGELVRAHGEAGLREMKKQSDIADMDMARALNSDAASMGLPDKFNMRLSSQRQLQSADNWRRNAFNVSRTCVGIVDQSDPGSGDETPMEREQHGLRLLDIGKKLNVALVREIHRSVAQLTENCAGIAGIK